MCLVGNMHTGNWKPRGTWQNSHLPMLGGIQSAREASRVTHFWRNVVLQCGNMTSIISFLIQHTHRTSPHVSQRALFDPALLSHGHTSHEVISVISSQLQVKQLGVRCVHTSDQFSEMLEGTRPVLSVGGLSLTNDDAFTVHGEKNCSRVSEGVAGIL